MSWWSADARVADVSSSGLLIAAGQGVTSVVARVGSRAASMRIVALPVLQGQLISPDGGEVTALHLVVRTRARTDTVAVVPSGRFTLRMATLTHGDVDVHVDASDRSNREHHASIVRIAADELGRNLRIVLVPTQWTIRAGRYAGRTVPIRLPEALDRTGSGSSFWRLTAAATRRGPQAVGWPAAVFPIPVAFRPTSRAPLLTRGDSVSFWAVVRDLEDDFGADLFRPARGDELTAETSRLVLDINPAMNSDGFTFVSWNGGGTVFDGSVTFRHSRLLSDPFVVTHEMLHALGFGHTSAWPSVMSRGAGKLSRATPEDVAHAQVLYRVRAAQAVYRAAYGIAEAMEAERRLTRR